MNLRFLMLGSFLFAASLAGAESVSRPLDAPPVRVGVYDSRLVAYAHFHGAAAAKERADLVTRAKTAQAAGRADEADALKKQIVELSRRSHLQVFSTAPADEAMAALREKLPALQAGLGVARFVSKWNTATLREVAPADQVDVTERLVAEFLQPTEKQRKTLDALKASRPIALWKAKLMTAFGGM